MKDVRGKVVLVTGAAMGIGKGLVEKFCEDGATVIMVDLVKEAVQEAHKEFKERGFDVHEYICDVSAKSQVYKMADWVKKNVGTVQVLFNSAGLAHKGNLIEADDDGIEKTFDVNVKGTIWTMKAFLPGMMELNDGHVINMASASGFVGVPGLAAYASSKWAVIGLSESVRREMIIAEKKINFTIVCPSYVNTGMFEGVTAPKGTGFMSLDRIVNAIYEGFKKDEVYVKEPFMVKFTPAMQALLPMRILDLISKTMGVDTGTENFVGRFD